MVPEITRGGGGEGGLRTPGPLNGKKSGLNSVNTPLIRPMGTRKVSSC